MGMRASLLKAGNLDRISEHRQGLMGPYPEEAVAFRVGFADAPRLFTPSDI
jgi:hypothetical protein